MQKWGGFIVVLLLILFAVPRALAFDGRTDDTVVIAAGEDIQEDLYLFADTVVLNGKVRGDVYVIATSVEINGVIEGDLVGIAQHVVINGAVQDDTRLGAYAVTLNQTAHVTEDFLFVGNSVETLPGSRISGNARLTSYQVSLNGAIAENLVMGVAAAALDGTVGGSVRSEIGAAPDSSFNWAQFVPNTPETPEIEPGFLIGKHVEVGGNFDYRYSSEIPIPTGVVAGSINYVKADEDGSTPVGEQTTAQMLQREAGRALQRWMVLLLLGMLLMAVTPQMISGASGHVSQRPIPSFVWGLVVMLLFPFLAVMSIVLLGALSSALTWLKLPLVGQTLLAIGVLLVLLLVMLYVVALVLLAQIVVGYYIGRIIFKRSPSNFWPLALGLLVLVIVTAIPYFIGNVVSILVTLAGLGALWLVWRRGKLIEDDGFVVVGSGDKRGDSAEIATS